MFAWTDHRADRVGWAGTLGVSREAVDLVLDSEFVDLHCVVEVPVRLWGYDPARRHHPVRRPPPFFCHTDYPRLREAGLSGVVYDITTNPLRPRRSRQRVTLDNLARARARIEAHPGELALVRNLADYRAARQADRLAMWLSLQGGNALAHDPTVLDGEVGADLHRITLVHGTTSVLGGTSSPLGRDVGLTGSGGRFVEICNARRILVDLAHAGPRTFWGALEAHSAELPPIVSHTGVCGVHQSWRNLDDDQVRAIAERGGVVGIIYHSAYLERAILRGRRGAILDHLEHVVQVGGEESAALGSDYDGMIIPPADLADVTAHPLLVQDMLDRGWAEKRIRRVLGENYLRVVGAARPGEG